MGFHGTYSCLYKVTCTHCLKLLLVYKFNLRTKIELISTLARTEISFHRRRRSWI